MAQLEQSFQNLFVNAERVRYEKALRPLMRPEMKRPETKIETKTESPKKKVVWADDAGHILTLTDV